MTFKTKCIGSSTFWSRGTWAGGRGCTPTAPALLRGLQTLGGVGATPGTTDMGGRGEMQGVMAWGRDVLSRAALRKRLGLGAARPPWPPRCPPGPCLPSHRLRATAYLGWTCFRGAAEIDAAH